MVCPCVIIEETLDNYLQVRFISLLILTLPFIKGSLTGHICMYISPLYRNGSTEGLGEASKTTQV